MTAIAITHREAIIERMSEEFTERVWIGGVLHNGRIIKNVYEDRPIKTLADEYDDMCKVLEDGEHTNTEQG